MTARVCLQSGRVRDSLGFPTPFFFKLLILCVVCILYYCFQNPHASLARRRGLVVVVIDRRVKNHFVRED